MSYDSSRLDGILDQLRVLADELDAFLDVHGGAVCARETTEWRKRRNLPDPAWKLLTWSLGLESLRSYRRHWHPDLGIDDPKRPCTVAATWVRF